MRELGRNLLLVLTALGSVAVPAAIARVLGFDPLRAAFAGIGVTTAALVWMKPRWFWEFAEIAAMRKLLGSRIVALIYYGCAGFFIALSILAGR
jgi:hypothetical protein